MVDSDERRTGRRRDFLKYAGASAATATLAGCASYGWTPYGETGGTTGGGGGGGAVDGDVDPTLFEGETFKFGILAAGLDTTFGAGVYNSAKLAIDQINAGDWWLGEELGMQGLLGAEIVPVHGNTQLQAARTKRQYNRLTRAENCVATFGAAQVTPLLQPMAETQKLHLTTIPADPLPNELVSKSISVTDASPEEEYEQYKYFFRPGPINTVALGKSFIEFFDLYRDELGWDTIAFLNENGVEDDTFMEFVPPRAREMGLDVPVAKVTSQSLTNWTPIFDELEANDVDAAIVVQLVTGAASVNQWASQQRDFEMGGIHIRAQLPTFWDDTAGNCEGIFTMNAVTPETTNTPLTQTFMSQYAENFPNSPGQGVPFYAGPITYDAVRMFAQAVVETGVHPAEGSDTLVEHMENPSAFTYLNGTIFPAFSFRPPENRFAHDPIFDCMVECDGQLDDDDPHGPTGVPVWQQWHPGPDGNGVMESFAPDANQSAEYIRPPWLR